MKELETKGYFINKDGVKSSDLLKKGALDILRKNNDNLPKQPISGYKFFAMDSVQKIMDRKGFNHAEASKICSKMWDDVSSKGKAKYHEMHDKDVQRYQKQLLELQTYGYFTLENGTKSTDECNKILKKRKMPVKNQESEKTIKGQNSNKKAKTN